MKKIIFALLVLTLSMSISAQSTRYERKWKKQTQIELNSLNRRLSMLEDNILSYSPEMTKEVSRKVQLSEILKSPNMSLERRAMYQKELAELNSSLQAAEDKKKTKVYTDLVNQKQNILVQINYLNNLLVASTTKTSTSVLKDEVPRSITACEANKMLRSNEVKINDNKVAASDLAIAKMANSPVIADSIKGYRGVVANLTEYTMLTFVVVDMLGLEKQSWTLDPGVVRTAYLLPGIHHMDVYAYGVLISSGNFEVFPSIQDFRGAPVHFAQFIDWETRPPYANRVRRK